MTNEDIQRAAEEFAGDYLEKNIPHPELPTNHPDYNDGLSDEEMLIFDAAEAGYIAGWEALYSAVAGVAKGRGDGEHSDEG